VIVQTASFLRCCLKYLWVSWPFLSPGVFTIIFVLKMSLVSHFSYSSESLGFVCSVSLKERPMEACCKQTEELARIVFS